MLPDSHRAKFYLHGDSPLGKTAMLPSNPYLNPVVSEMQEIADLLRGIHEAHVKLKKTIAYTLAAGIFSWWLYQSRGNP